MPSLVGSCGPYLFDIPADHAEQSETRKPQPHLAAQALELLLDCLVGLLGILL